MGGKNKLNQMKRSAIQRPLKIPPQFAKFYFAPELDLSGLKIPVAAQMALGLDVGRGPGGDNWQTFFDMEMKAFSELQAKCLVVLIVTLKNLLSNFQAIVTNDDVPMGDKQYYIQKGLRKEMKEALRVFEACMAGRMAHVDKVVADAVQSELMSLAKDTLMAQIDVSLGACETMIKSAAKYSSQRD